MVLSEENRQEIIKKLPGMQMPNGWAQRVAITCGCSRRFVYKVWNGESEDNAVLKEIIEDLNNLKQLRAVEEQEIKQIINEL